MSLVEDFITFTGTVVLLAVFGSIILICIIALFDKVFSYWLFHKYDRETIWKIIKHRNREKKVEIDGKSN